MNISVVVCSLNGGDKLAPCLAALVRQADGCEIVVVDDGSTDHTAAVAESFGVTVIKNGRNLGLSRSRNVGWRHARGDVVAFTDDDCVPDPGWLKELARSYQSMTRCVGVGGPAGSDDRSTVVHRYLDDANPLAPLESELLDPRWHTRLIRYVKNNVAAPPDRSSQRTVYSLVGANMSFRRDALEAMGGFDDRITFGGDEEDLCQRLRARYGNDTLHFDTEATVRHRFVGSVPDVVRRARSYGRGNARRVLKAGGLPPLFPFPIVVLAGAMLAVGRPRVRLVVWLTSPLVLYRRGFQRQRHPIDSLAHPYLALLEEAATMFGFVEGWWQYRRDYRSDDPRR